MRKILFAIIISLLFTINAQAADSKAENEAIKQGVTEALDKSVTCWNKGDLDCFLDAYVQDQKTLFITDTTFLYGWEAFYEHYKKKYGNDKPGMGHLEIKVTGIEPLDSKHAFLYGRWYLKNNKGEFKGVTSLLFLKVGKKWQIMVDHSNS